MVSMGLFTCSTLLFLATIWTVSALESYPGYTRDNPPPSGYWYSDEPGSYNPWTDDISMDLMVFPASNKDLDGTRHRDIQILPDGEPDGWDMWWYNRVDGPPAGKWDFVDLSEMGAEMTGTNWPHGPGYEYPADSIALRINDTGKFDPWRVGGFEVHDYRGIAIEVSNLGDTYLVLSSDGNKWLGKGHNAIIGLEPGATDILYHPFRRRADDIDPAVVEYFGTTHQMTGYPGGQLFESVFTMLSDVEGPWTISATVPPGIEKKRVSWTINRMWAGGRYQVPTMAEITSTAYDYDNYTDTYGQWKHDDWTGKVWDADDCVAQYQELQTYLDANPGPVTWNMYGGWENGPQLEATGWFRMTKYPPPPQNTSAPDLSRWWFVDPLGKLFLSQGSLHMGGNMPKCARDAGYTQERFEEEIYYPRLRSMGLNTVGGNSAWKYAQGKVPYTYQIKTGWAPIKENDFLNGGADEFATFVENLVFGVRNYAADPFCMGFVVDNELDLEGGNTLSKDDVDKIYFGAIRAALDKLSEDVGRPEPMLMFDPSSNGGVWMAEYCDVLSMHRMDGYHPATHRPKFKSVETWGVDKPVGQYTFSFGNLDQGIAHYGITMFLNQRNRAQGMHNYMSKAYNHPNNIACHHYAYMKTKDRPLAEFRFLFTIADTTDYFLADKIRQVSTDMYRVHMGESAVPSDSPFMNIVGGAHSLTNGDDTPHLADHTDFGTTDGGNVTHIDRVYTVMNTGAADLELGTISITGQDTDGGSTTTTAFTTVSNPASNSVAQYGSVSFTVRFTVPTSGNTLDEHYATVSVPSNDPARQSFSFMVMAGGAPRPDPNSPAQGGGGSSASSAGVAVGVTFGILIPIAVGLGAYFLLARRKKQQAADTNNSNISAATIQNSPDEPTIESNPALA